MKYDVIIIGGGPAGYTAAEKLAAGGLQVLLFEKRNLGGVCLNEGCIPTKTLLYSAKLYDSGRQASKYGVEFGTASFDLGKMVARKSKVVRKLVLGIKSRLAQAGVEVINGEAFIIDKNRVRCGEVVYESEHLLVCTGSETFVPPIPGVDRVPYWTHKEALEVKELPRSLTILGGGVIGVEFASYFNSLGVKVTVVEMMDEILSGMDRELAALLREEYSKKGVSFLLSRKVAAVKEADGEVVVEFEEDGVQPVASEKLLLSVGRRPVVKGFGLENLNLEVTKQGYPLVNPCMQTSIPSVYVCGDLTGFSLLAHTAVCEAEVAAHTLLGQSHSMSYRAIPGVVYSNPEFAGVGYTEEAAMKAGIDYVVRKMPMTYSGRFVAENEAVSGLCKLILSSDGSVLGAHLLGNPASELITLAAMAIQMGLKADEWKRVVFPHPTVSEIFKEVLM